MARLVGHDSRGWAIIDVAQSDETKIFRVRVGGRAVELVSQPVGILRVYVNPSPDGMDEWQIPAGTGPRMKVGTPVEGDGDNVQRSRPVNELGKTRAMHRHTSPARVEALGQGVPSRAPSL